MIFSFVLILLLFITTGLAINFRHQLNSAKRRGNYGKPVRSSSPLLACPFCGMDAVLYKWDVSATPGYNAAIDYTIQCSGDCVSTESHREIEWAIEVWNQRAANLQAETGATAQTETLKLEA